MDRKEFEERLAEKKVQFKELEDQLNALFEKRSELDEASKELKRQYVLSCPEILSEAPWSINFSKQSFWLESHGRKHKVFSELLQSDYHCSVDLEPGIELHFADDDISVHFDSLKRGLDFIEKYKVKTNIDQYRDREKKLEEELRTLREFLARFGK